MIKLIVLILALGGGGGEPTVEPPAQDTAPIEQDIEHTDIPGHDVPHVVWSWRHVETWKLVTGGLGTLVILVTAIIALVKLCKPKKET